MSIYDGDRDADGQAERHSGEPATPGVDPAVTPEQSAAAAPQPRDTAPTPDSLPGTDSRQDASAPRRDEDAHVDLAAPEAVASTSGEENEVTRDGEPSADGQPTSPDGEPAEAHSCPGCPLQQEEGSEVRSGERGEPLRPPVLLQAGTDPDSLKALALCREKVQQLHLRMHPLAARWDDDRHVTMTGPAVEVFSGDWPAP